MESNKKNLINLEFYVESDSDISDIMEAVDEDVIDKAGGEEVFVKLKEAVIDWILRDVSKIKDRNAAEGLVAKYFELFDDGFYNTHFEEIIAMINMATEGGDFVV